MRVLVAGGAGYIGSHTVVELVSAGHDVLVVDNFANSTPKSVQRCEELVGRAIGLAELDLCDFAAVDAVFAQYKPDAVIHFAGFKAVGESNEMPVAYYHNNIGSTLALLQSMDGHGCAKIVFSSSATVYGAPQYLPCDEDHPCDPTNPYGRTKYFIEHILRDWAAAQLASQAVILRYFNPVGAHVSGRIGENPLGVPNNLVPYITQVAAGKREALSIFGDDYDTPDGTGLRDYIHVVDLARAHVAALDHGQTGASVFNVGTGKGASVMELLKLFEEIIQRPIPHKIAPRRQGDVAACVADPTRASRDLSWTAELDLFDMCASAWTWQSRNPQGYT
jgi:UDP-glucose 4-epimerase